MNRSTLIGSVSSSDLIDAKLGEHGQMCASKQCPSCGHKLERRPDWVGLPAGVKFDPTDQELIEHLEAKVKSEESKSHPLIDEFIPTIEGEDGICYTHPERLPGVTRDGLSKHFFHRPSKAYTTGTRKRRKIQTECDLQGGETRWHKTGKTRPVIANGRQKGCKKILVLYTNFGKNRKPEKTNWVMHQYHLGELEEEKEGELVVSKIFFQTQPRVCNGSDRGAAAAADAVEHRREGGVGGSSSSSRAAAVGQREDLSPSAGAAISGYGAMDVQHLKSDNFNFAPFRKSFDEVGMREASPSAREAAGRTCEDHEEQERQHHHHHHAVLEQRRQAVATAAFHVSRPSNPISTILSPPPLLHQTSLVLEDPYTVSRMMLHSDKFQSRATNTRWIRQYSGNPARISFAT
ncbi:hypothetical protein Taro_012911 [Colocasia esculenta]|uniref:NAC domain-containing protein n=1 Tax=Colocasia esculenta TaxID=4460 RepID=A0A843UE52_COLES|nr:hypothetical protein [Colocasia esculenta]